MKIAFFNSIAFDRYSGGRTRAMNIYRDLSDNYEIEFINLSLANQSRPATDVNYFDASWGSEHLPLFLCRIITALRAILHSIREGFDVGYAYRSVGGVPIVSFIFCFLAQRKLIVGMNDFPNSRNNTLLKNSLVNKYIRPYILRKSDAIIAINSQDVISHLLKLGIKKEKIKILPNRIEIREYEFNPLPDNRVPIIFYVGRDWDIKLLIEAAKKLAEEDYEAKFILAGVRKENYPKINNIQYLGKIPHSRVKKFLFNADICVVPYSEPTTAGVPVKILEYMASGKCIVATDIPSNTSILEKEKTAIITKPFVEDFTAGLARAINNPDLRKELGEKTHSEVKKFSREEIKNQLDNIIREIISNKN